jgi:hypothetical protein
MRDNRCPSCENDITEDLAPALVACLDGDGGVETVTCPHCHAELSLTVAINTTLTVVDRLAGAY